MNRTFVSRQQLLKTNDILNEVDDANLKEDLRSCQLLFGDSELERVRHKVFKKAIENFIKTLVDEKLDHFFNNLKRAAEENLALGFF